MQIDSGKSAHAASPVSMFDEAMRLQYLRKILWDVDITPEDVLRILDHGESIGGFGRHTIYNRLLRSFSWHVIERLVPRELLPEALSDDVLLRLWPASLRERYEYARTLVSG